MTADSLPVPGESFVPIASPAVHTVELEGEAVLLDQAADRLHHLNATAALVWACIDGQATLAEIARDLSEGLGAGRAVVLADTITAVRSLGDEGLLANLEPARVDGDAEPTWQRATGAQTRRSLDAWLVMPHGATEPVTLAGSAVELWDLLAEPRTVSQLVRALAEHYEADVDELRSDLVFALDELAVKGVLWVVW